MHNLLIEQKGPSGSLKVWRLGSDQGTVTFGTSKHSDLRSPEESVKGMQGIFEFRDNCWYYINLDLSSHNLNEPVEVALDKATDLVVGMSRLHITPFNNRTELFANLSQSETVTSNGGKKPYQLFTVHHGHTLLETKILRPGEPFVSKFDMTNTRLIPKKSEAWTRMEVGPLQISQRTIYLSANEHLKRITQDQVWDEGGKKTLYATLAGSALLALLFLLSPNSEDAGEIAAQTKPPEFREVTTVVPKKRPMSEQKVAEAQPAAAKTEVSQSQSAPAASKNLLAIKSLSNSRISQLIGKVSASTAKSNNVIVSNGISADKGTSGRALAAVGAINQSGKDWNKEGTGTGVQISTAGVAGGKAVGGMGKLTEGKTGTGGADLLEDESEVTGGLDREVIAQYIRSQLGQILYCYERQLSSTPDLYGKVAVRFTISGDGQVETQRVSDSTLKNAMVEGCILQKVAKWKFPAPDGGTKVLVTYPFLFKSTN